MEGEDGDDELQNFPLVLLTRTEESCRREMEKEKERWCVRDEMECANGERAAYEVSGPGDESYGILYR